jgi:hypothetical protein
MTAKSLLVTGAAVGLLVTTYRRFLRQPILTWGATAREAAESLPGDELLEDADGVATRAVTIDAPRSAVCRGSHRWRQPHEVAPTPTTG